MKLRRMCLSAACVPFLLSGVRRVDARDPAGDADLTGYGGTTSGGWTCGPSGRVRYAGGAVNASVYEGRAPSGRREGVFGTLGAAAEQEQVTIAGTRCSPPPCPADASPGPPTRILYGGHARMGYAESSFGFHVGLLLFEAWKNSDSTSPSIGWLPEVEVTLGDLDKIYGVVGLGSPTPTTLRRPGLYGGFSYGSHAEWGIDLRSGLFRAGPSFDVVNIRADVTGRIPITQWLSLRAGAATARSTANEPSVPVDFELSVGPSASF